MLEWLRFALVIFVIAVDDVLGELKASLTTIRDFIRYRVRWIVQEKWRSLWHQGR
jgi:hypothetical protein